MMQTQLQQDRRARLRSVPGYAPRRGEPVVEGLNRSDLVQRYAHKVRYIAERIAARLPHGVEVEDLVSVGFIGLLDAADKYDPEQGSKFTTYAEFRIRGAIYDELRAQDWVPRRLRDRAREIDRVSVSLERRLSRRPGHEEVADALGLSSAEYTALRRDLGAMTLVSFDDASLAEHERGELRNGWEDASAAPNPFSETSRNELRRQVHAALETFPDRERMTLNLYYFRGLSFSEIGAIFGISEARVCQIHARAMGRLRSLLDERIPDAGEVFKMLLAD